jgi:hypothetical protein
MTPKLYLCPSEGKKLRTDRDAVDLIGDARGAGAETIAIPVERLDEDFFVLRTRVAGEFVQKFQVREREQGIPRFCVRGQSRP